MIIRNDISNPYSINLKALLLPGMVLLLGAIVACTGSAASDSTVSPATSNTQIISPDATKTPLPGKREALLEGGTPVNKAGTANVTPLPNQIGDCILEPGTDCQGADLRDLDLSPARANSWSFGLTLDLSEANLSNADLSGSNLTAANLEGTNFTGANLSSVDFKEATLYRANLTNANLTDVKFTFADLEDAIFNGATFCRTRMPDGSDRNDDC
ncbi:MAG: pentapeptide repeat-containing protein [Chloroflexi bacterium]|nr:pentapeptide repeat-containing protein [Chloroflexota bacterium]